MKETLEYKCLQSQFSLLYNESLGVKTQLDEARALLLTAKNAHLRQIEHMEVNFIDQRKNGVTHQRKCKTSDIFPDCTLAVTSYLNLYCIITTAWQHGQQWLAVFNRSE